MKFYTYFSNQQRLAIIVLVVVIIVMELFWVVFNTTRADSFEVDPVTYEKFQNEVDSLRALQHHNSTLKLYPFNPNYITDYKGYTLGMSAQEINLLQAYRAKGKWINSAKEFQRITKVSDSLLKTIAPYFKFPNWVTGSANTKNLTHEPIVKTKGQKIDLNTATVRQLQKIYGIGAYYSEVIIRFRNTFDAGFIADVQLQDVKGLTPEVIQNILKEFTVQTPRKVEKINLNTATVEQLVTVQHIDYELAYEIII